MPSFSNRSNKSSLLWLPLLSLCSATPVLSARASVAACNMVTTYPIAPSCPGTCCGWLFDDDTGGIFCQTSTATTLALSPKPANWIASCTTLIETVQTSQNDYVLTSYETDTFYLLVSNSGCSFDISFPDPPDSDSVHISWYDIVMMLNVTIETSQDGAFGATGASTCWSYPATWRVVPLEN